MAKLRAGQAVPLGASLTKVDEPEDEQQSITELFAEYGLDLSIETVRAQLLLDESGVKLPLEERIRIIAAFSSHAKQREQRIRDLANEAADRRQADRERRAEQRANAMDQPAAGCVYFIRHGEHVKIGTTVNTAEKRMRSMQLPPDAKIVAVIPDRGRACEAELHRRFAATRVHGEWFATTPELEALISTFTV